MQKSLKIESINVSIFVRVLVYKFAQCWFINFPKIQSMISSLIGLKLAYLGQNNHSVNKMQEVGKHLYPFCALV